ncbi:MAG TPA: 6-phosphogluconolactonase, partial [Rheinheimera sp.]|nr:6-phosphogluconolactonase [Rheinheimera sp.]
MMQLQQFNDTTALNNDFAARLVRILQQAIAQRGAAYLVVSGGKTPQALFNTLSQTELAWDKVTVLLADDRWLDASQNDSNERLVKATLLQNHARAARFISLYADTESAFSGAEQVLPRISALPTFDAVILGMGEDGHT